MTYVEPRNHVLDTVQNGRHLANTTERPVLCITSVATCYNNPLQWFHTVRVMIYKDGFHLINV